MSGLYLKYPRPVNSSGGSTGSVTAQLIGFQLGSMDAQAASAFGASISSVAIFMQSATAAAPGLVNIAAQTFGGNKTFSNQVLLSDGTVSAPSLGFTNVPSTGFYKIGSGDIGFSLASQLALEMQTAGSNTNFAFGTSASNVISVPVLFSSNFNGTQFFQYGNNNTGSSSATVFQVMNGSFNTNNATTIENYSSWTSGYMNGGSAIAATLFQTGLYLISESTSGLIAFNVNGRTQGTQKAIMDKTGFTLNGGMNFSIIGSSSSGGTITQQGNTLGSSYSVMWPGQQGPQQTVLANTGSGSLAWVAYSTANNGSALVQRDVNGNATANNFVSTTTTIQSSGTSNLILTAGSARIQKVIGSNSLTITLPNATTLYSGQIFEFNCNTTQTVTIVNTGSTTIATAISGSYPYLICTDNSTVNGVWDVHWLMPASAAYGTAGLNVTGNITATTNVSAGTLIAGSTSFTSSTGGAAYTLTFPGAQGVAGATPMTNGLGALAWQYPGGPIAIKSANYAIGSQDGTIVISSGTATITLPIATNIAGQIFSIWKGFSSTETIIIATASSQTMDNSVTMVGLDFKGESITFQSLGSGSSLPNWTVLHRNIPFAQTGITVAGPTGWSTVRAQGVIRKDILPNVPSSTAWRLELNVNGTQTAAGPSNVYNIGSGTFSFGQASTFQSLSGGDIGTGTAPLTFCRTNPLNCTVQLQTIGSVSQAIIGGVAELTLRPIMAL